MYKDGTKNDPSSQNFDLLVLHIPVLFCPNSNLIEDKISVLGLDIVERQV